MRKSLFIILNTLLSISIFFAFNPTIASAHPGNTDVYGCHVCESNCSYYNLYPGQYHCSGVTESQLWLIEGVCHESAFDRPIPMEIATGKYQKCVRDMSLEQRQENAEENLRLLEEQQELESELQRLQEQYDREQEKYYQSLLDQIEEKSAPSCPNNATCSNGKVTCMTGYAVNASKTGCIELDDYCKINYGGNSYAKSGNCSCKSGYQFNSEQTRCVEVPVVPEPELEPISAPVFEGVSQVTVETPEVKKEENSPNKEIEEGEVSEFDTDSEDVAEGEGSVAEKKGFFSRIFSKIGSWFKKGESQDDE